MKKLVAIFIGCLGLLLSSNTFANCSGCEVEYVETSNNDCTSEYITSDCECSDLRCSGRYDNPCLSRVRCCEAFGNIGAR